MSSLDLTVPFKGYPIKRYRCLDGEALAALGAASLQNGATALGCHTGTEAMGLCATTLIRLVSTFHYSIPPRGTSKPLVFT